MTAVTVKELKEILATTKAPRKLCDPVTGKSFSEALTLASVNPQYDKRFFIEFPKKYKFRTCCVQILFFLSWHSKQCLYITCSEDVFFL